MTTTNSSDTTLSANSLTSEAADPQLPVGSKAKYGSIVGDDLARKASRRALEAHERNCRDKGGGLGNADYTDL